MAIGEGFRILNDIINNSQIFGVGWIPAVIIIIVSLFWLSLDTGKWKGIILQIMVGWYIAGVKMFEGILIIGAIIYVMDMISVKNMGTIWKIWNKEERLEQEALRSATRSAKTRSYTNKLNKLINLKLGDEVPEFTKNESKAIEYINKGGIKGITKEKLEKARMIGKRTYDSAISGEFLPISDIDLKKIFKFKNTRRKR